MPINTHSVSESMESKSFSRRRSGFSQKRILLCMYTRAPNGIIHRKGSFKMQRRTLLSHCLACYAIPFIAVSSDMGSWATVYLRQIWWRVSISEPSFFPGNSRRVKKRSHSNYTLSTYPIMFRCFSTPLILRKASLRVDTYHYPLIHVRKWQGRQQWCTVA